MLSLDRESVSTCTRLLVSQLQSIERAHRAGITPRYGQLEELFETAGTLRRQLEAADEAAAAPKCATAGCKTAPIGGTSAYAGLCMDCAAKVIVVALTGAPSVEVRA